MVAYCLWYAQNAVPYYGMTVLFPPPCLQNVDQDIPPPTSYRFSMFRLKVLPSSMDKDENRRFHNQQLWKRQLIRIFKSDGIFTIDSWMASVNGSPETSSGQDMPVFQNQNFYITEYRNDLIHGRSVFLLPSPYLNGKPVSMIIQMPLRHCFLTARFSWTFPSADIVTFDKFSLFSVNALSIWYDTIR